MPRATPTAGLSEAAGAGLRFGGARGPLGPEVQPLPQPKPHQWREERASSGERTRLRHWPRTLCALSLGALLAWAAPASTNAPQCLRDQRRIWDAGCLACHGPQNPQGNLRLDSGLAVYRDGRWQLDLAALQPQRVPPDAVDPIGVEVSPRVARLLAARAAARRLSQPASAAAPDRAFAQARQGSDSSGPQPGQEPSPVVEEIPVEEIPPPPPEEYELVTGFGWTGVRGNRGQFREHLWQPHGWNGGLERYSYLYQPDSNRLFRVTARALRDDYKLSLSLQDTNVGFAKLAWEQYGRYFNSAGGYSPTSSPAFGYWPTGLRLDVGRAEAELGLTLPSWPRVVLGYEYWYRSGDKALTQWRPTPATPMMNILPNAQAVDEQVHAVRLDLSHGVAGFNLSDQFRYEWSDSATRRAGDPADQVPGPTVTIGEADQTRHWANALRLERALKEWWTVTAGYLYTHASGEAAFNSVTFDATGQPVAGYFWNAPAIVFHRHTHTANLNTLLGPWQGLSGLAGLQAEWADQTGFGKVTFNTHPDEPARPGLVDANHSRVTVEESVGLRFERIPATTLFAEGRFRQEQIDQFDQQLGHDRYGFRADTDILSWWTDLRAGFRSSPWRRLSFGTHYRYLNRQTDYDHVQDLLLDAPGQPLPGEGYPAFMTWRQTRTDGVEGRVSWRASRWLKTTLNARWMQTDYRLATDPATERFPWGASIEATPGGRLRSAVSDARHCSLSAVLTPWRRLQLSSTLGLTHTATETAIDDPHAVVPYEGPVYSVLSSATAILSERTDLQLTHLFSRADYDQTDTVVSLPLGISYRRQMVQATLSRRFGTRFLASLRYGFHYYDEPTSGHINDYTAHTIFASLTVRMP